MKLYVVLLIAILSLPIVQAQNVSDTSVVGLSQMGTAQWITKGGSSGKSLPVFRKTFLIDQKPNSAMLTITALGIYDAYVNGVRVGDYELQPGWTDYRKEVNYQTYDIVSLLHKGENEVRVQLSQGWWAGDINRGVYGKNTPLSLMSRIVVDGKCVAETDESWECSTSGPLLVGDIYGGEVVDARLVASDWHPVSVDSSPKMEITPLVGPPVRIRDKNLWRQPKSIVIYKDTIATGTTFGEIKVERKFKGGKFVLRKGEKSVVDFGQNMVGWICFDAKAKRGTQLTFRHGEMLNYNGDREGRLDDGPGGSVWTYNLRAARAQLCYTFRGDEKGETYHPRHTFMGFRYAEVTATDDVEIRSLVGQVVGSDIEEWGCFECSSSDINQLYSNILWGQRGNFLSVPTDCPQRDERLGWTGDTQIFARTALYNSDVAGFYRKWMGDMRNSQRADGAYPDIAPYNNFWGYGTAAWGDAGVIVPWTVYVMTGDKTILEENFESMSRWMEWLSTQKETLVVDGDTLTYNHIGAGTATGDWLAYAPLNERYVSVAYYAYVAQLMDSVCATLGKLSDAAHYRELYNDIREEFQRRYVKADGTISEHTQTAYLLALRFKLLPEEHIDNARRILRKLIEENDYCLSTGFVGTGILCTTLTDESMNDLAYSLLLQRKNPSWLYSIDQGATTVWERWDSFTLEDGFHKHHWNMNSFNHYAYGAVAEWMYSHMCGIRPGKPGFRHVVFSPHVDDREEGHPTLASQPRVTWAKAKTRTPYGEVHSSWKRMKNGNYEYSFVVPKGVTYDVVIPNLSSKDKVRVSIR